MINYKGYTARKTIINDQVESIWEISKDGKIIDSAISLKFALYVIDYRKAGIIK